jgi:hypothetical protein
MDNRKPLIDYVSVDSTGHFVLHDIDFTGKTRLLASVTDDQDKLKGWLILDSSQYDPAKISWMGKTPDYVRVSDKRSHKKIIPGYLLYSEYTTSLKRKYNLSDTIRPGEVNITARRQTSPEEVRSQSQHYLRSVWVDQEYEVTSISKTYVTAGRLLTERFWIESPENNVLDPSISNNQSHSISNASIEISSKMTAAADPRSGSTVKLDPIFLLDGNEVGWEGLANIPIEWIARVDYVKGRNAIFIWGIRGSGGVVSVMLKPDLLDNKPKEVYPSETIKFTGFNEPRIFYSPKHHTSLESDYKPDLRNTLFWDPDITLKDNKDTTIVFYNSDNPGLIIIKAEGITDKGIPVTGSAVYRVEK